jgi:hypothetical protein
MAVEATPSLTLLNPRQQSATATLAHLAAVKAVKRRIQAEGKVKVWLVRHAEIRRLADEWLRTHPELYAMGEAAASAISSG